MWWGAVLSRRDGESACDEATIRTLGEGERGAYARTLLRLTCGKPSHRFTAATTMAGSPRALRERITRIAQRTRRKAGITVAVLALAAVAAGCTFPGSVPSSAVPIQREFDGEVPEAVAALTENAIADIAAGYNEDGAEGGYVTEAKLTGLTPVPIEVSTGDAGVAVYRVEYRLHVRNGPAYLLAGGAQAEPSPTGGMWLTEWTSAGQPYYAFYWEEKDGETTWQLVSRTNSDSLAFDYGNHGLEGTFEDHVATFAWEVFAQHHNGVSITSTFSEEVPQEVPEYVQSFLTQRIGEFQKTLAEAGSDGAITQAELTALPPVVTQEASDTDGVVVYRVDYRLQGEGNLAPPAGPGHGRRNHRRGHLAHPREQSQPALLRLPLDHSGWGASVDLDRRCHPRRSAVPLRRPGRQFAGPTGCLRCRNARALSPPKPQYPGCRGTEVLRQPGVFCGYSSSSSICRSSRFCPALLARPRAKKARESSTPQARKVTTGTARKWPSSRPVYRSP